MTITIAHTALTFAPSETPRSPDHGQRLFTHAFARAEHTNRFGRANGMTEHALTIVLWAGGIAVTIIGGLLGVVITLMLRNADRTLRDGEGRDRDHGRRSERVSDKQATQAEIMAGVVARVGQLEEGHSKIADALDRLTRLEEFRLHAMPKLEEAEETARTVIAFGEQMKTVFRRIDTMTEQMNKLPNAVASELRSMIRPIQGRAANG